jgi:cGMP-dependent protein kinase
MGISCAKNLEIRKTLNMQATSRPRAKKHLETIIGRRRSALNKTDTEYPEAATAEIIPNTIKTGEDMEKIKAALNSHFIFTSLTEEDKDMVIQSMQLYSFQADSYVFMQSSRARSYYVIRTGSIEVFVNNKKVNKIHAGEGFGELALLQDNPRSASLKCAEPTTLWGLDRETFRKVIEEMNVQVYQQNRNFLEKVGLLDSLTPQQKDLLAVSLVSRKYFTGQNIITEGETGNEIFFVKEGIVGLFKGAQEIKKFYPGSYFGENALINNTPRTATCRALEDHVKCMCLTRDTLQRVLTNKLQDIIEKNTIYEAIKKSTRLSALTKEQKESLFRSITERHYKAGDVVIGIGTSAVTKMIFVMSGRLQYAKNSTQFYDKGSVIGDIYVTRTFNDDVKYQEDFIAGCDMKVGEITKYQFEMAIGGKYEDIVKENAATNVLRKIFLFTSIESSKMKELFSMISIEKRKDSEILLREGISSNSVYIVKRGKVDVFQAGNLVKTIRKLGFFGERSLLDSKTSIYTYVANGNVTLWNIKLSSLSRLINEKMIDQLNKRLEIEDEDAELNNLIIIRELGRGKNSLVYLVRTPRDNLYALKVITRDSIEKHALFDKIIVIFK